MQLNFNFIEPIFTKQNTWYRLCGNFKNKYLHQNPIIYSLFIRQIISISVYPFVFQRTTEFFVNANLIVLSSVFS